MAMTEMNYASGGGDTLQDFLDYAYFRIKTIQGSSYSPFALFDVSGFSQVTLIVGTPTPAYYTPFYTVDGGNTWTAIGGYNVEITIDVTSVTELILGIYNNTNSYFLNIPLKKFVAV